MRYDVFDERGHCPPSYVQIGLSGDKNSISMMSEIFAIANSPNKINIIIFAALAIPNFNFLILHLYF